MNILEVRNLTLEIEGKKILDNLNFEFEQGKVHAVVGPNGAGKTSLAFTLLGVEAYKNKSSGQIIYDGRDIAGLRVFERAKKGISMAWQEPARYEGLTVKDFIQASSQKAESVKIEEAVERMGLSCEDYLHRAVDQTLSGGERKKIELASLLIMEARLVLLDEPDSGIDIESLEKIFEAIKYLKQKGVTVVLITHSLAVLKQSDYALLICSGEIVDRGSSEKIIPYFESKCIPCPHKNVPDKQEERAVK